MAEGARWKAERFFPPSISTALILMGDWCGGDWRFHRHTRVKYRARQGTGKHLAKSTAQPLQGKILFFSWTGKFIH